MSCTHAHTHTHTVQALERHKAAGSGQNAEEILESVQEEVMSKHKDEQQKQTKKINSLVSSICRETFSDLDSNISVHTCTCVLTAVLITTIVVI